MSTLAMLPSSTASPDGGMMMASPPVPSIGPIDMYRLYPRRDISGTISAPSIAVLPMLVPDSVANTVPPATVRYESRPGSRPKSASNASNTRTARPVWKKSSPIRRNSGMGTNTNSVTEDVTLAVIWASPASPPMKTSMPMMLTAKNENATGIDSAMNTSSSPTIRAPASYHSTACVPAGQPRRRRCRAGVLDSTERACEASGTRGTPAAFNAVKAGRSASAAVKR